MPSRYPEAFDADDNLYLAHDALRLRLAEDYNPGDTTIAVEPDDLFSRFPPTGLITLTEQCSDIGLRALSFGYSGKGDNTFTGVEVLAGFTDVAKPKRVTDVTQNVMSPHHNQLKDALIAIERFVGIKGVVGVQPLQGTMEARINFLRKLVLKPKGWFTATRRIGIVPLCVEFKDFSTRQPQIWSWDFGDGNISVISRTSVSQIGTVTHCYVMPSVYDVGLTVTNDFGSDTLAMSDFVTARVTAPDPATITFIASAQQIYSGGVLRSRANQLISILVQTTGEQPLDPIQRFVWDLTDDLSHDNTSETTASYSIGGLYDVKITTETLLGAYRTTTFENTIDVVEKFNLWHMIFNPADLTGAVNKTLYVYEFGLLSETYKAAPTSSALTVTRDAGFLTGEPNYNQQYQEFRRNNGFAPRSLTASGNRGAAAVFWAEGAAVPSAQQKIRFREWNGFDGSWIAPIVSTGGSSIDRQWNWLALNSGSSVYFVMGSPGPGSFVGSPTNQSFTDLGLTNYGVSTISFNVTKYLNGADELMQNVGGATAGNYSVYRGTWKDSSGYLVRNDGVGGFFRMKSFYRTEGTVSLPLQSIRKLTDMPGATKFEGQMVPLTNGIYFFNNTGEMLLYNPVTNTWGVGGPGVNSPNFAKLQDSSVVGYDSASNPLVAVSDQSTKAYLFFDYSTRAQTKFSETDLTFTSLPVRPSGEQFLAGVY